MARIILRAIPSFLVLVGGVGLVIYGAVYHKQTVTQEEEIEINLAGPPGIGPPSGPFAGPPGMPPFAGPEPPFVPPPFLPKITETVYTTTDESEANLIQEVTVGGVTLLSGVLQRTYSGDRPSLCPT